MKHTYHICIEEMRSIPPHFWLGVPLGFAIGPGVFALVALSGTGCAQQLHKIIFALSVVAAVLSVTIRGGTTCHKITLPVNNRRCSKAVSSCASTSNTHTYLALVVNHRQHQKLYDSLNTCALLSHFMVCDTRSKHIIFVLKMSSYWNMWK